MLKILNSIGGKQLKILGIITIKNVILNIVFSIDFCVVPDNVLNLIDAIIGRDIIMKPSIRTIIQNDIKIYLVDSDHHLKILRIRYIEVICTISINSNINENLKIGYISEDYLITFLEIFRIMYVD